MAAVVVPASPPLDWGMKSKIGNQLVARIVIRLSRSIRQGRDATRATERFLHDLVRLSRNWSYAEAGSREVLEAVYDYVDGQLLRGRGVDLYGLWQKYF